MAEKIQATATNATVACCSPQNGANIAIVLKPDKGFFEKIVANRVKSSF